MEGLTLPIGGSGWPDLGEHDTSQRRINQSTHAHPSIPPKCRLVPPKVPIFGCFHPMDLHFGRRTTSHRGLTATKRGELHYMRLRHADDTRQKASCSAKPPPPT